MDLSVIIVNYNTRDLLRDCLASALPAGADLDIEIIVIDNGSSDGSAEMVESAFPDVRLLRGEKNVGFAAGNNIALRLARGRYVLLLNSDTVVQPGAFSELVRFMNSTPAAGYCGPKLLNGDGSHQDSAFRFPTAWTPAFITPMAGLVGKFPDSRHIPQLHPELGHEGEFRADWLSGAALMVRRSVLDEVGLLDEGFFMYWEEIDWCVRMSKAGWEGWYVGSATIVHLVGRSVAHENEVRLFGHCHPDHYLRSMRRYTRKHFGRIALIVSEAVQIVLYLLILLRNSWPFRDRTPLKARSAVASIRFLILGTRPTNRT